MKKAKIQSKAAAAIPKLKVKAKLKAQVKSKAKATMQDAANDIIALILADHKPLKRLIKILKDTEASVSSRRSAMSEFGPLLTVHAQAEEKALYKYMEKKDELREESFEGEVEHNLADLMLKAVLEERNQDKWSAKAKVLAELVEHHVEEEEKEMLPEFKAETSEETRRVIGEKYLGLKKHLMPADANQSENESDDEDLESTEAKSIYPSH